MLRDEMAPLALLLVVSLLLATPQPAAGSFLLLDPADYSKHYTALPEVGGVSGSSAFAWAQEELPFVDLPGSDDADLEAAYYYRSKVLREHILETGYPDAPYVVSECKFATTTVNATSHKPPNGTTQPVCDSHALRYTEAGGD
jgi:hypothetical protein